MGGSAREGNPPSHFKSSPLFHFMSRHIKFKRTYEPFLTICHTIFENEKFPLTMHISLTE